MNQENSIQTQTQNVEDVRKRAEEIRKNIEELNQQLAKLKELIKNKMLDDEFDNLRKIADDMSAWIWKLTTYFTIQILDNYDGEVAIRGKALGWIRKYGTLDLTINKVFDDFFADASYFNNALKEYTAAIIRIAHKLPDAFTAINEVKQQLATLENKISKLEDEVEELTQSDDP